MRFLIKMYATHQKYQISLNNSNSHTFRNEEGK
jgi:hypothetical protein